MSLSSSLISELQQICGENGVMTSEVDRQNYSYDAAVLEPTIPAAVVRPNSKESIGKVISLCNDSGTPVTVRGAGTNLSGGTIPNKNGIVLLTNRMNRIIELNETDMYVRVEPGVVTADLAAQVAAKGLFYPPDPGSQAVSTIGGNVAENAGGLRGFKYGVTKDYVMAVEFFDALGRKVTSGSKTVKCVTGYNLAGLMTASEGTLGVFSEITLKLIPPPAASKAMMAVYDSVETATQTVAAIIADRIVPCTLEFMDNFTINAVEDFANVGLPRDAKALLLIEVDGHPAQVAEDGERIEQICKKLGARAIQVARNDAEKDKVWEARRAALSALARLKPTLVLEDATVPRSQIPAMVSAIEKLALKYDIPIGTFGHAGDGNLHPTLLTDRRDVAHWERVENCVADLFDAALSLGGTLSGEHGIGIAKAGFMKNEVGQSSIDFCRTMKAAIDPNNILNPGKIIGQ
ncbi:glycolate oxidase subunit GlcD [Desulfobacter hydrogenophilus]|uniref:FAD-binding protein n=1 Tax=Desulfobacter hydrogenophilus TaxID=2291 RepID=A0A328FGM7_9BACT|nr:FAD-linked oxidase C-terminal domain-containing protein [Desulfobacter hydrogenophilus]NDY72207.1 FAD-binding protein [Desulfobacter hydrogenophilus]QBH15112.1 FAD-binding protein [Desulfobacter hydrogenophilus]RAM02213.1 glycolate oxidase subunit GlcD [Desulfobacter hydrogenophilus]